MAVVIKGGTLIDGTGKPPVPNATVVVEGDSILQAGPASQVTYPAGAQVIDAAGKTILPGMIDAHAHMIAYEYNLEKRLTQPASLTAIKTLKNLKSTLEAGVTTVRDGGGADAGIKMAVEQGLVPGPRLFITHLPLAQRGSLFDLPMGSGAKLDTSNQFGRIRLYCGGVETLRAAVRELVHNGADVIKVCTTGSVYTKPGQMPAAQFAPDEIAMVVSEAQAAGKRTMTHAEGGQGLRNAIVGGINSIEHGFYLDEEDLELMLKKGTFLVPTLACNWGILKVIDRDPKAGIHEQSITVAKDIIADHAKSFSRAVEAGVKIAMGSDSFGWDQGENLFELELMVRAGLSPMKAIVAATSSAAELLGVQDQLGTLASGKLADVLVVDGDPLADIKLLQNRDNLRVIMQGGKLYKNTLSGGVMANA